MREQIKAFAEENGRSMNQEIIEILREQFPDPPSDAELMDQLEVVLAWARDLKSANRRHTLSAHLMSFIEEMKRRTPVAERTAPLVEIERPTLDLVDRFCERLNKNKPPEDHWGRDEVAENLIKMSLMRIERGEEKFKSIIILGDDLSNASVVEERD
jgi:hypothetical protein